MTTVSAPRGRYASALDRFWSRVEKGASDDCWLWTGELDRKGYGRISVDKRRVQAHRFSYELAVGPIGEGLQIDHLCRVRNCVKPAHLEPVTPLENNLRALPFQDRFDKEKCKSGHPRDAENLIWRTRPNGRKNRDCRACKAQRNKASRDRRASSAT